MSANRLYPTCFEQIAQLRPNEWGTRLRNLAWLMVGILKGRSVHLGQVAKEIPGPAKDPSLARRLGRFPTNSAGWHPGTSRRLGLAQLTVKHVYPVNLLAHRQEGEDNSWLLATTLPMKPADLQDYRRRM